MGCCLSIFGKKGSESASGWQLDSSEASPTASVIPPRQPDENLLYPNPLFIQRLDKNFSRGQPIRKHDKQAVPRQPDLAIHSDRQDPVMIATTYSGSLKYVKGAHHQSYPYKDRSSSVARKPLAPMTESLRQRESKEPAFLEDGAHVPALAEGVSLGSFA